MIEQQAHLVRIAENGKEPGSPVGAQRYRADVANAPNSRTVLRASFLIIGLANGRTRSVIDTRALLSSCLNARNGAAFGQRKEQQ